ncbi:MAG: hypothetical protein CL983_01075 [Euryarchaeota archaeon]|nr:hypothetical protein [Euryarchaeota archaeon]|tara:strand:- start:2938 stop:3783 length:846 start_codon:yes stop_codon:yes gene_type:complete
MLGNYYYHQIIRKTIIAFGTLFNDIHIRHTDGQGNAESDIKVPLAYGPSQKFLARLDQQADLNKAVQITLPRLSFEMTSINYDPSRKSSLIQTFKTCDDGSKVKKVFMPVPYNIGFELNLLSKLNDDSLQVLEQILPYFQPHFNLTIDLIDSIGEKRDIPIVLESIGFQDDYEGNFDTRRALIHTFNFTAKTYLFGAIADSSDGLIRKVQVDMYSNTDTKAAKREVRYTVTPKSKVDRNDDGVIDAADHALLQPGDDFGFDEGIEFFSDGKTYSEVRQTDI